MPVEHSADAACIHPLGLADTSKVLVGCPASSISRGSEAPATRADDSFGGAPRTNVSLLLAAAAARPMAGVISMTVETGIGRWLAL